MAAFTITIMVMIGGLDCSTNTAASACGTKLTSMAMLCGCHLQLRCGLLPPLIAQVKLLLGLAHIAANERGESTNGTNNEHVLLL
ncbi:hypothetical protein [Ferrimonas lipolytica]|uniref:Uncharacterized protein n=1 Tax=Ferrimonas lipolytica TaxID=2724191 RepID=A0A6H1UF34_9GAMM|nr:hypothetical protein [Ferrimonas lipolytica]QIZ77654.1 hypothetical protein HER31_12570 [Ferrimonas lipolytica]